MVESLNPLKPLKDAPIIALRAAFLIFFASKPSPPRGDPRDSALPSDVRLRSILTRLSKFPELIELMPLLMELPDL